MSNPEQGGEKPVSKPEVQQNVSVQEGADKVENRGTPKGSRAIGIISLVLVLVVVILSLRYLL